MTGTLPTTSFGRRTPSLAQLAAETRTKLEAGRSSEPVHKWRLYRTLTEAKAAFGLPDGTLTVLQALLAFHTETALTLDSKDPSIVVFPSNRELSIRANGVPESTLRRHLARLVAVGLIARRNSPNGKKFARRGREGETTAFGFDLAPFIASKGRIEAAAAENPCPRGPSTDVAREDHAPPPRLRRRDRSARRSWGRAGGGIRGGVGAAFGANSAGAEREGRSLRVRLGGVG